MDHTTLLIILIIALIVVGGGWYGRGRWFCLRLAFGPV
jgi:hypothetical protein